MLKTVLYTEGVGMKVAGTGEIFIELNEMRLRIWESPFPKEDTCGGPKCVQSLTHS